MSVGGALRLVIKRGTHVIKKQWPPEISLQTQSRPWPVVLKRQAIGWALHKSLSELGEYYGVALVGYSQTN